MDETRIPRIAFDLHKKCEFHALQLAAALSDVSTPAEWKMKLANRCRYNHRDNASYQTVIRALTIKNWPNFLTGTNLPFLAIIECS